MKKNILFWSPFVGNIGTKRAVINSAKSICRYTKHKVYLLNVLGEFNDFEDSRVEKINIFNVFKIAPQTGYFSKLFIFFFSCFSIPFLFIIIKKKKINLIISFLLGIIPLFIKQFFKEVEVIASIQGFPKFTFIRTILWKKLYTKSQTIFTMSNLTKNKISKKLNYKNIYKIDNPIISKELSRLSKEKLDPEDEIIFKKKVIICVGRLTPQKNFLEVILAIKNLDLDFNLLILGDGEQKQLLKNEIKKHKINNVFLLGHKANPYKYLSRSELFISSSLWEDPGHALIESAYLNTFIITSDCDAGPKEMFLNRVNCLSYPKGNGNVLSKQIGLYFNKIIFSEEKEAIRLKAKKLSKNFTEFRFFNTINKFII